MADAEEFFYQTPRVASTWDDLLEGVTSTADWPERRASIQTRFLELLRDEARPPRPSLDVYVEERVLVDGIYERWSITYPVGSDERAHAYLGIPVDARLPLPGVVALHQTTPQGTLQITGQDEHLDQAFLDQLCRRGFAVLAPEHFVAGRRIPPEGPYETKRFYDKHPEWTAVGKSVFEHSIALDVLAGRPEVDEKRLGCVGHSLGGHGAYFLAAYDDRVRAAVGNCAAPCFRHNPEVESWARDAWYVYFAHLRPLILQRRPIPIDFHEILALIAPRALLDISGCNDGDVGCQRQRVLMLMKVAELYDLLGSPQQCAYFVHGFGHAVPLESRELIAGFLQRVLE